MSRFPADWLRLREPHDHRARDRSLVAGLERALPGRAVDLLDLGCGLGSDLRFVAPLLERPQRWWLADHDPDLLEQLPEELERWARGLGEDFSWDGARARIGARLVVEPVRLDLRAEHAPWPEADAVLTQALLDLVDEGFLDRLAERLGERPLLASLTVDGRVGWHPSDPEDERVQAAFRAHQLTDRGFGPSPGPRAAAWLAGRLSGTHRVSLREADWRIPPADRAMIRELVEGAAHASGEILGEAAVEPWRLRRAAQTEAGGLALTVGHLDLLAVPRRATG